MTITNASQKEGFLAGGNVYVPHVVVIEKVIDETPGVRTFHFNFKDEKLREEYISLGEKAIATLSEVDDNCELARAHYLTGFFYGAAAFYGQGAIEEVGQKSWSYSMKARAFRKDWRCQSNWLVKQCSELCCLGLPWRR